jgi:hypothetical protein
MIMNKNLTRLLAGGIAAGILALANRTSAAGQFQYSQNGDLLAGFRKPGLGSYELVVNLGNVTNLENMVAGTTVALNNFSPAQLTAAFPDGFGSLNWSVSTSLKSVISPWGGYPALTLWYTLPRMDANTRTTAPQRASASAQGSNKNDMLGVGTGAVTISGSLGASNANNTPFLVREPVWDGQSQSRNDLSYFIDNIGVGPVGSFGLPNTVENVTPDPFAAAARSDFYRARPTGNLDPDTGTNAGPAYYVGYFQLNPDGTLTFTRASTVVPTPPAPQVVKITRFNTTSTIYFTTTNGAIYTLYYTNHFGIGQPVTSWAAAPGTVAGNGNTNSLSDTTTESDRYYRVGAQ